MNEVGELVLCRRIRGLLVDVARLPYRHPRALRIQPGCDVHRRQLLEKELGCVGDVDLRDLGLVLAWPALERVLLQVARSNVSCHIILPYAPNYLGSSAGELTQLGSSAHKYHICALGRHPIPRIVALSRRNSLHGKSCNHAPSHQSGGLRPGLGPRPAV